MTDNKITNLDDWKKLQNDYIVRATAANGTVRAFAAYTKKMVSEAKETHHTSPVATAALGRLLTAGAMMGVMLKGDGDLLTMTIKGDGPLAGETVTANANGEVKGFVYNPDVWIPLKRAGKLDVGGAVGRGTLTVIRDQGMREPYSSQVELQTGEIADDLTYYFVTSEQVPSSVGLGVLVDTDQTVRQAGGFIIQLMPGVEDETIDKLEANLKNVNSVTDMLEKGMTPEEILESLIGNLGMEILDTLPTSFKCNCSRERVSKVLLSLGEKELQEMIDEGKPAELKCHFCEKTYTFSVEEMKTILQAAKVTRLSRHNIIDIDS